LLTRIKDYLRGTQVLFTLKIATHQNPPSAWCVRPVSLASHLSAKDQVA
jgi:hypothetical protein